MSYFGTEFLAVRILSLCLKDGFAKDGPESRKLAINAASSICNYVIITPICQSFS